MGAPLRIGEACSFYAFRASNYKLHFLESPSGLKMVLNSDQDAGDLREHLQAIYLQVRHVQPRGPLPCMQHASLLFGMV